MAILKIARMGHPTLRQRAAEVADPAAPGIAALVADMIDTMADADGLGLAAPQVHVDQRVVIFHAPRDDEEAGEEQEWTGLTVLVNPAVEPLGEEQEDGWEGCLSVPGLRGLVPRYTQVRYSGVTPGGERVERVAEGLHARVVQHECDHLDGILFPQRMTDLSRLIFESEFRHLRTAAPSLRGAA
ncbi:MAG: peptide deformylase [Proteobacteria bacterium]|nr:peptide deformylase [Pseudomonadota bacterium]